ncbi:Uncharacterised protein [Mycobacterium tuberculosis]|nr:Uncharacterised protein [Mycobacterium tuberculosis]
MAQKWVSRKCVEKHSSMRFVPRARSGVASRRMSSSRSWKLKPRSLASSMRRLRSISRACASERHSALKARISSRTVRFGVPGEGMLSSTFHRQV